MKQEMISGPLLEATLNTLIFAIGVALLSGFLGAVAAWLITRTEFPGRARLERLLTIPYALPPYLLGMAWMSLANPSSGILLSFLKPLGLGLGQNGIYGLTGMILVEASMAMAYPYLELVATFRRLDPALEEAARMSGATPLQTFFRISFKLVRPALISGMTLSFLHALASFGIPALLGLPVRRLVLTTLIYSQFKLGGLEGIRSGFLYAGYLLVIALFAMALTNWIKRISSVAGATLSGGKTSRPSLIEFKSHFKWLISLALWLQVTVALFLPWIALGIAALAPVPGQYAPSLFSLSNFTFLFGLKEFREGALHSTLLAIGVASTLTFLGLVLGYLSRFGKPFERRIANSIIHLGQIPFAIPGSAIALILILLSTKLGMHGLDPAEFLGLPLFWLAIAYGIKYVAMGLTPFKNAYSQLHASLEEAALVSGANRFERFTKIWIPLMKGSIQSTWILAALPLFTELTMSVFLTGPGAATLGTALFRMQEYADQGSAAALAFGLLTLALLFSALGSKEKQL